MSIIFGILIGGTIGTIIALISDNSMHTED